MARPEPSASVAGAVIVRVRLNPVTLPMSDAVAAKKSIGERIVAQQEKEEGIWKHALKQSVASRMGMY